MASKHGKNFLKVLASALILSVHVESGLISLMAMNHSGSDLDVWTLLRNQPNGGAEDNCMMLMFNTYFGDDFPCGRQDVYPVCQMKSAV